MTTVHPDTDSKDGTPSVVCADEAAELETDAATLARVDAARLWLVEFFPGPDEGCVRMAQTDRDGWAELQPFRHDRSPFAGEVDDHAEFLDSLAESIVTTADLGVDLYCCPYRHPGGRIKGCATRRAHAHADVDGPIDLDAARALGCIVVASGTVTSQGEPHGHVYARLSASVRPKAHESLCRALGAAVGGEHHDRSKCADNDVLRPAGSLNWKGGQQQPVAWLIAPDDEGVKTWEPEALAAVLNVPWPVSDSSIATAADAQPVVGAADAVGHRLDRLVRAVADAPAGRGNEVLNWAAGKAAALCATVPDAPDEAQVRAELQTAFLARPIPPGESTTSREREALSTIRSGWTFGSTSPAKALRAQHVDGAGQPDQPPPEHMDDEEEFWGSRPLLGDIRDFARARHVGPWALLGAVLARAAAHVPPSIVLPPTRGSVASLNPFVAICSESGGGKSAAAAAAEDFLEVTGGCEPLHTSAGSGEGLLAAYVTVKQERGQPPEVIQHRVSVLLDVDEVGALGALMGRTSSTLLPFLKSAWSGRLLATQNAEAARLRRVEAHAYRLALVAGVQPERAGVILDDEAGGFPQRWLWLPTYDPGMVPWDQHLAEPESFTWAVPSRQQSVTADGRVTGALQAQMELPEEAVQAILAAAQDTNRPIGDKALASALDAHALLTRAKTAALLALLNGRAVEITAEDWNLAGVVVAKSDETRAAVVAVRAAAAQTDADRKAQRQGRSAAIAAEVETDTRVLRAMEVVRGALRKAGGEANRAVLSRAVGGRYRGVLDDALDRLLDSAEVVARQETAANGKPSHVYRLGVTTC